MVSDFHTGLNSIIWQSSSHGWHCHKTMALSYHGTKTIATVLAICVGDFYIHMYIIACGFFFINGSREGHPFLGRIWGYTTQVPLQYHFSMISAREISCRGDHPTWPPWCREGSVSRHQWSGRKNFRKGNKHTYIYWIILYTNRYSVQLFRIVFTRLTLS